LAFPEYEKIARNGWNSGPHAPSNISLIEESAATDEVAALYAHFANTSATLKFREY
jgi:hypothetical protein